ncbi:MAG: transposase [Planctomycetaceae bacterium]|nr:transposase [Planctomycetaceae bacterium]
MTPTAVSCASCFRSISSGAPNTRPQRSIPVQDKGRKNVGIRRPAGDEKLVPFHQTLAVERTFAWIGRYRRHSKDYERNTESSKAMIYIAMTARMLKILENHVLPSYCAANKN